MSGVDIFWHSVEAIGVVFMPIIMWILTRQDRDRRAHFTHLDTCIDDTKSQIIELNTKIVGTVVTRPDLERAQISLRAEINMERLERERNTAGLHDRLMRLEDIQLRHRQS